MFIKPVDKNVYFEECVYKVFPMRPIPIFTENANTEFNYEAKRLLSGRTWSEVIGNRLNFGGLNVYLMTWLRYLPLDMVKYYLPSHLILASMVTSYNADSNYAFSVMDVLILPSSEDPKVLAEMDFELCLDSSLISEGTERLELYKTMNPEQRACIADFLSLYGEYNRSEFTDRGFEFYTKNIEYWRNSALNV
ncbi:hypothetical protein ACO0LM_20125 [Undibacterium sp. Di26W]|uniref:hypothetical protein n=1 Tax=Undibacterium sp. Di26W TaxID=3413035 RepID=UPI003BF43476